MRGAKATKQSSFPRKPHWIASLTLAMTRRRHRSRGAYAPEFCLRPRTKKRFAPAKKEGGEAPKGACQPLPRVRRQVYAVCATYLLRGRAPNRGAPAFRRYAAALVRNCDISDSAPGHASWDVDSARCEHHARRKPAGVPAPSCPSPVTAPHASAVIPKGMMPKAAPERVASPRGGTALAPLPKVPSRRRPSMSEILQFVTVMGTIVKSCPDFDDQAHGA